MKALYLFIYAVLCVSCRTVRENTQAHYRMDMDSIRLHASERTDEIRLHQIECRLFYSPPDTAGRQHITEIHLLEQVGERHLLSKEEERKEAVYREVYDVEATSDKEVVPFRSLRIPLYAGVFGIVLLYGLRMWVKKGAGCLL